MFTQPQVWLEAVALQHNQFIKCHYHPDILWTGAEKLAGVSYPELGLAAQ